jgi:tripartite-type tricarboxylate transporter receptor subunit TctC
VMVPKGTPQPIIDKLAATVPQMFENARVARRMKAGGSPMQIMTREEVQAMWKAREETLKELLADL